MTCRHQPGDPACTSGKAPADMVRRGQEMVAEGMRYQQQYGGVGRSAPLVASPAAPYVPPPTPDCERFEILDAEEVNGNLVLKVKYPNCSKCFYDGTKVMVYLGVDCKTALRWRRIDPHFADPSLKVTSTTAPPPAARFPASAEGWADAIAYATGKGPGL